MHKRARPADRNAKPRAIEAVALPVAMAPQPWSLADHAADLAARERVAPVGNATRCPERTRHSVALMSRHCRMTRHYVANVGLAEELGSGMRNLDKFSRLYSGRVASLEDGDIFRASVPVVWHAAATGQDPILALASSIIDRDGSLSTAALAEAGGVTVRTAQRWIRKLSEQEKLVTSARDPRRYVLPGADAT